MFQSVTKPIKPKRYTRQDGEEIVQDGLSLTPAQMDEMVRKGVAVSTQSLGVQYYDDSPNNSYDVPVIYQRGVDMAEAYESSIDSRKKVSHAVRQSLANEKKVQS